MKTQPFEILYVRVAPDIKRMLRYIVKADEESNDRRSRVTQTEVVEWLIERRYKEVQRRKKDA